MPDVFGDGILLKKILLNNSKVNAKTRCREWLKSGNAEGRGMLMLNGKTYYVPRLAAYVWLGYNLADKRRHVLHKCNNPRCLNFRHLYIGTQKENVRDAFKAGNRVNRAGILNGRAELDSRSVLAIRELRILGWKLPAIARLFGVSTSTIHRVASGAGWKVVK